MLPLRIFHLAGAIAIVGLAGCASYSSIVYYSVTGLVRFEGKRAVIDVEDPLSREDVEFASHRFPLAADFTASLALALARENPKKLELARLLRPQNYAETHRLARLQPYDPNPISQHHG